MNERQKELLTECGFSFESIDEIILYVADMTEFLETHNKNLNNAQYHRITTINDIFQSLKGGL